MKPFFRKNDPVRVAFNATSASAPFAMPSDMKMADRKTFLFSNMTPYDVRLIGTPIGSNFIPVTDGTGWPIMARTVMGPFTSQNPAKLSVQAYSTPGNPIPQGADFTGCFLELVYGEGE